jgi:hypothetical protein
MIRGDFKKITIKITLALGCLAAMVICVLPVIQLSKLLTAQNHEPEPYVLIAEEEAEEESFEILIGSNILTRMRTQRVDHILDMYRELESQKRVIAFFAELSGSKEIAELILANSDEFNISPALAFALCWQESQFIPQAYNNKNLNGSVDRGLFQLNNLSFPHLNGADFYDPEVNVYHAMKHLRVCIDISGGSEITALAIYNAGANRVRNTGTPMRTLAYINAIQDNRAKIENHYLEWESAYQEQQNIEIIEDKRRIIPLIPLGIR